MEKRRFVAGICLGLGIVTIDACIEDLQLSDHVPPVVSIVSPPNNSVVIDTTTVVAIATDSSGVTKVEFYVNGALRTTSWNPPWRFLWDVLDSVPFSVHTIQARAFDPRGNIGISNGITVLVNKSNLLSNGSFESSGVGSFSGWHTLNAELSSDTPPFGGHFSLRLPSQWVSAGQAWTSITAPVGTHRYRLSVWAKVTYPPSDDWMALIVQRAGVAIRSKSCSFADTTWTMSAIEDTLTTMRGDMIVVSCGGDGSQFGSGYIYFDLFRLQRFD